MSVHLEFCHSHTKTNGDHMLETFKTEFPKVNPDILQYIDKHHDSSLLADLRLKNKYVVVSVDSDKEFYSKAFDLLTEKNSMIRELAIKGGYWTPFAMYYEGVPVEWKIEANIHLTLKP